jgi:hypothetical protein
MAPIAYCASTGKDSPVVILRFDFAWDINLSNTSIENSLTESLLNEELVYLKRKVW